MNGLLEAASKGVGSVDVQMNPRNCQSYTPLCAPNPNAPGTIQAQPIFFAMLLVRSLEGGTVLKSGIPSRMKLPTGVSDYAVQLGNGDDAVIVDNTTTTDVTQLSLKVDPSARVVSTLSLQAPALNATSGVTLTSSTPSVGTTSGLRVPADSAVVFTLAP